MTRHRGKPGGDVRRQASFPVWTEIVSQPDHCHRGAAQRQPSGFRARIGGDGASLSASVFEIHRLDVYQHFGSMLGDVRCSFVSSRDIKRLFIVSLGATHTSWTGEGWEAQQR